MSPKQSEVMDLLAWRRAEIGRPLTIADLSVEGLPYDAIPDSLAEAVTKFRRFSTKDRERVVERFNEGPQPARGPLTPAEAKAILAWIKLCEGFRAYQLIRQGSDGADGVAKFTAEHPSIGEAFRKLQAIRDSGEGT